MTGLRLDQLISQLRHLLNLFRIADYSSMTTMELQRPSMKPSRTASASRAMPSIICKSSIQPEGYLSSAPSSSRSKSLQRCSSSLTITHQASKVHRVNQKFKRKCQHGFLVLRASSFFLWAAMKSSYGLRTSPIASITQLSTPANSLGFWTCRNLPQISTETSTSGSQNPFRSKRWTCKVCTP